MTGITLIELMIVVVVVSILAAIAVPSYRNYVLRAQRSDATAALLRVSAAQEKFYLRNNTYTTDVTAAGLNLAPAAPLTSEHGWYTIGVAAGPSGDLTRDFTATAAVVAGGAQATDSRCASFSINERGVRAALTSGNQDSTEECWR